MENIEQPALCRLHTLNVVRVDKKGIWLHAGDLTAHLPTREAPNAQPGDELEVFLYQVADNETCMAKYGVQAVVWQTGVSPVIAAREAPAPWPTSS